MLGRQLKLQCLQHIPIVLSSGISRSMSTLQALGRLLLERGVELDFDFHTYFHLATNPIIIVGQERSMQHSLILISAGGEWRNCASSSPPTPACPAPSVSTSLAWSTVIIVPSSSAAGARSPRRPRPSTSSTAGSRDLLVNLGTCGGFAGRIERGDGHAGREHRRLRHHRADGRLRRCHRPLLHRHRPELAHEPLPAGRAPHHARLRRPRPAAAEDIPMLHGALSAPSPATGSRAPSPGWRRATGCAA